MLWAGGAGVQVAEGGGDSVNRRFSESFRAVLILKVQECVRRFASDCVCNLFKFLLVFICTVSFNYGPTVIINQLFWLPNFWPNMRTAIFSHCNCSCKTNHSPLRELSGTPSWLLAPMLFFMVL